MTLSPQSTPSELTLELQAHINRLSESGGGRLEVPPGLWVCGALELKSGVELYLGQGAHLRASDDPEHYLPVGGNDLAVTANDRLCAMLWAREAENIAVSGPGILDGGGDADSCPDWKTAQGMFRPAVAYFEDCRDIRIEDTRIVNSKWWTLHLRRCQDIRIRNITMDNTWPNSDGIDPDGCRDLIISDSRLRCGDDCIVIKSTKGDASENAVITNCLLETPKACFKLGTESFGDFRNILLSNCVLRGDVGFGLYLKDGGCMENIRGMNLIFDTASEWPVLIDAMARDYQSGKPAGVIRNVCLSDCTLKGPGRVWIEGPEDQPLETITLRNLDWDVTAPVSQPPATKPTGSARTRIDPDRPKYEDQPEHILAIHTRGLRVENVHLHGCDGDRPLLYTS